MSPPALPTPAPSTDLLAKRSSFSAGQIDQAFSLPPAAITSNNISSASSSTSSSASDSSYRPLSPSPGTKNTNASKPSASARRRSSAGKQQISQPANTQTGYTLPPPPTRSRKIIEMKPRASAVSATIAPNTSQASSSTSTSASQPSSKSQANKPHAAGQKRKQANGSSTAAGRKIARKTAHSLIERRRRSKMNEEFAVLKDMIPACSGQDMHKLQVLTASIEYMQYLENCLTELKAVHARCPPQNTPAPGAAGSYTRTPTAPVSRPMSQPASEESDIEMSEVASLRSSARAQHRQHTGSINSLHSHASSISPAILPSMHTSPALSSRLQPGYSLATNQSGYASSLPSPAFSPRNSTSVGYSTFRLTSPAIEGQTPTADRPPITADRDDHEATAALLMLNTDRRSWSGQSGVRGMSVKDLLSS